MTASTVLMGLPRDATSALDSAGGFDRDKVVVRFKAVGPAPALRRELCKFSATQKFEAVVAYLRRVLKVKESESIFLYVNSTFAPALDELVGNLQRVRAAADRQSGTENQDVLTDLGVCVQCFKDSSDQLNVSYSMTPAFG